MKKKYNYNNSLVSTESIPFDNYLVIALIKEWAIAEQKEVEEKLKHGKNSFSDANFSTVNADETLAKLAKQQQPLEIPVSLAVLLCTRMYIVTCILIQ